MADNSKIEWTDATWNPVRARRKSNGKIGWHCEHITPGCKVCYAERFNLRLGTGLPFKPGHRADVELFLDEKVLTQPLRWKKPRVIFPGSMTDLFADFVPDEWIDRIFAVMALTPQHTYQPLTKRSDRMREYMARPDRKRLIAAQAMPISCMLAASGGHEARIKLDHFSACFAGSGPFPNVWLGVSTERQQEADERIPHLLATPAAVRFISAEPLLGPINLTQIMRRAADDDWTYCDNALTGFRAHKCGGWQDTKLDWVIAGGESGDGARPMHPDWARSLRDQCAAAGVPFFFKQWGAWSEFYDRDRDDPDWRNVPQVDHQMGRGATRWHNLAGGIGFHGERLVAMRNVGKGAAGRLLDGIEHNGMPRVA